MLGSCKLIWVLIVSCLAIVVIMSVNNAGQTTPWGDKMRRLRTGVARKAEWMAPDEVVHQVCAHYLEASTWLQDNMLSSWAQQWSVAPHYLSGSYLRRHQNLLLAHREIKGLQLTGILRADHNIEIRQFSENGDFCLVVDHQTQRRMATYNRKTQERSITQDLGDGVVIYVMLYDDKDQRWKIGNFVQELPSGWRSRPIIEEHATLPDAIGRDY